ncbi:hypothetical protein AS361_05900 [Myroides marinus]|uniref:DNA polymerase n=1 Tax=Myroides marinus TaxID=703342 RepID=UPI000741E116|nr:DNA polymerase [Myroides marinus]KUF40208.1 hypothetical protein AS361_05900 [Myroides marinus]
MKEFIICYTKNTWSALEIKTLSFIEDFTISTKDKYYTFQVSDLIRELKSKKNDQLPQIVNIESFDKQFTQKGKDLLDLKNWHILKSLKREGIVNPNYRITNLQDFLSKINEFILKLKDVSKIEIDRFNKIEVKINEIIHQTSLEGIKIDNGILDKKCIELHKEIYKIKNDFQFSQNIFQPEKIETQIEYLKKQNYKLIESARKTINLLRKSDPICYKFNRLNSLIIDLKTLMLLKSRLGGENYTNPYFVGFGSITSRIIIKEPSLQNLRKENRDVIIPNENKELFYIDYSQFEASILANDSKDAELLTLINNGDIYNDMIKNIFEEEEKEGEEALESRKKAKILFYRYLYGDSFDYDKPFQKKVEKYFKRFTTLTKYKSTLIKTSIKNGFVKTNNGNTRQLDVTNDNVWILSHQIQAKASTIFKKALIQTYTKVKGARLLIPLHDGALYEIENIDSQKTKDMIIQIYIQEFKKECKLLTNPLAKEEQYFKNNTNECNS